MFEDNTLLRRYTEEKSEEAFTALVQRHLDLVYSTALRQLAGDTHLAQDVTQTVFVALARKAASLTGRATLAGWLYLGAHHAAAQAVRSERRRRAREQEAQTMHELLSSSGPATDWDRVHPVLDEAMRELDEPDREAVLLRYFQRRPFAEIGATLRVSEDAARMRVDRALDKLRLLLAKRDITSTSAALAAALANQAVGSAPAGLAASVTGAALSGAGVAEAGIVAAAIAFMTATKTTVTLGVAAALTLTTAVYQSSQARTTAAALAVAGRDHAAARDRLAELESKARAAEQALVDREETIAQLAATAAKAVPQPPAAAATAAAEAAKQQKALQQYLESHPAYRASAADSLKGWWMAYQGPLWRRIGLTPEQIERAAENEVQREALVKERRAAGLQPADPYPPWAKFRALFGDAATERLTEASKDRWTGGDVLRWLSGALYYTEEPFTPPQTQRLTEILGSAMMTTNTRAHWSQRWDWNRVLPKAEPVLSPAQMQGLRAVAAAARMYQAYDAATKEANAAATK